MSVIIISITILCILMLLGQFKRWVVSSRNVRICYRNIFSGNLMFKVICNSHFYYIEVLWLLIVRMLSLPRYVRNVNGTDTTGTFIFKIVFNSFCGSSIHKKYCCSNCISRWSVSSRKCRNMLKKQLLLVS